MTAKIVFYSFYFLNSTDSEKQIEQFALFLSYWERAHLARSHSLSRILENSNFCRTKKKWDFISRKHASRPYVHTKLHFQKYLYTSDSVFNSASIGGKIIFVHLLWDLILACRSILNFISYRSNIPKFKNRRSSWCVLYCKEEYMSPQISLHERPIFNLIYKIWSEIGRKPVNNRFSGKKFKNRGSSWCVNRFFRGGYKRPFLNWSSGFQMILEKNNPTIQRKNSPMY